jgi:hypothetical protein
MMATTTTSLAAFITFSFDLIYWNGPSTTNNVQNFVLIPDAKNSLAHSAGKPVQILLP